MSSVRDKKPYEESNLMAGSTIKRMSDIFHKTATQRIRRRLVFRELRLKRLYRRGFFDEKINLIKIILFEPCKKFLFIEL